MEWKEVISLYVMYIGHGVFYLILSYLRSAETFWSRKVSNGENGTLPGYL